MANITSLDGQRITRYIAATGTGTDSDPHKIINTVEGALTDAELRATPIAVSGTVTANTGLSQPLTDTQLRATPIAITKNATTRTPTLTSTTTTGPIAAGCVSVSIANIGAGNGVLLGQTIVPGVVIDFVAPWGDTIGAIAYDATDTSFLIQELR